MSAPLRLLVLLGLTSAGACTTVGQRSSPPLAPASLQRGAQLPRRIEPPPSRPEGCSGCTAGIPLPAALSRAIENRLTELEQRGGVCSQYAEVLEDSYRRGRITLRPYMWRVGGRLVSGEARPNGDMTLALEIDSLNVGVRTIDDVLWSVEHEAVHIALRIAPGAEPHEDRANQYVRACRMSESTG